MKYIIESEKSVDKLSHDLELAVNDHHYMINKALSWALRELSKSYPQPVFDFIEKQKANLHKRVLREVVHKLETGTKN